VIQINLLPEEMRHQESTPWPRRMAIFAGAGILTALLSMVVIQRLKTLPSARRTRDDLQQQLATASEAVRTRVDPLKRDLDLLDKRRTLLTKIGSGYLRWTPRMDALHQVLRGSLDGVWITGLSYEERMSKAAGRPGGGAERILTIAFAASDFSDSPTLYTMSNEEKIAEVVRELSQSEEFRKDVLGIAVASWSLSDDFRKPPWNVRAITFPVNVLLTPPPAPEPPKPPAPPTKPG